MTTIRYGRWDPGLFWWLTFKNRVNWEQKHRQQLVAHMNLIIKRKKDWGVNKEGFLNVTSQKSETFRSWKFVFRWASKLWLVWWDLQCLDSTAGLGSLGAALSRLTCSFSLVWVFCSRGLLLPVQPLWLPLTLDRPLFLLAWWEVYLTSFWELYTERCICQQWSPALKEEVTARLYRVLMVT